MRFSVGLFIAFTSTLFLRGTLLPAQEHCSGGSDSTSVESLEQEVKALREMLSRRLLPCKDIDLRKLEPKSGCTTSTGVVFRLLKRNSDGIEVWRDEANNLTWTSVIADQKVFGEAKKICADFPSVTDSSKGAYRLPSKQDLERAEFISHFREVLPELKKRVLWSQTPSKDGIKYPFFAMKGWDGKVVPFSRDEKISVLCTSKSQ